MKPTTTLPLSSKTFYLLVLACVSSLSFVIPQNTGAAGPQYVTQYCFPTFNYTAFSQFQTNLNRLLNRKLYNEGAISGFNTTTDGEYPDEVYGLFLCRGDVSAEDCQNCIDAASGDIVQKCPGNKEAIIWYDQCLVRYSNKSFFSTMESDPAIYAWNTQNVTQPGKFVETLDSMLNNLTTVAISDSHMYATQDVNVSSSVTLHGLVQCTPDLSIADCQSCLQSAIGMIPSSLENKSGLRVLQPSCNIRYEILPFFGDPRVDAQAPPPSDRSENNNNNSGRQKRRKSTLIAIGTSVSISVGALLIGICVYCRKKKPEEENEGSQEIQLLDFREGRIPDNYSNEDFQPDNQVKSQDFPSIPLDIIQTATKNFSDENKLGEGGFGPVYKGTLSDGKEIAIKRLSRSSGQGLVEFKNEITLIARLQHRNLVRLLGCCLEGNETLLIYEYLSNKSLDVFLFDSSMGVQLDCKRRFSIINGIARGILYLHEDSRLRIIHRDLKVSNILLDQEMNPKISDFGMARIVGGNQIEANTNRIVGTYGYMAPEYAMEGLFSIKSDVFSFGVLLLEILSGKKNSGFYLLERGHSLLTFAWKLWSEGQGLELIDPLLVQSCLAAEVLKCIHIALLCVQEDPADRPTMSSVVLMLGSEIVTLPQPTEPAFSVGRVVARTPDSSPITTIGSFNEVTCTDMSPR